MHYSKTYITESVRRVGNSYPDTPLISGYHLIQSPPIGPYNVVKITRRRNSCKTGNPSLFVVSGLGRRSIQVTIKSAYNEPRPHLNTYLPTCTGFRTVRELVAHGAQIAYHNRWKRVIVCRNFFDRSKPYYEVLNFSQWHARNKKNSPFINPSDLKTAYQKILSGETKDELF